MSISEKDKKIVAAVFASRGALKWDWQERDASKHIVTKTIKHWVDVDDDEESVIEYPVGTISSGGTCFDPKYVEMIGTIEEYNQCLEDMAAAPWMNHGLPNNYKYHIRYCKNNNINTSNKKLLKEHCIYDKPSSAEKTLTNLGYRDCGGELWRPPLGKAPDFINEPLVYTQGTSVELFVEEHDSWYAGEYIAEFKGKIIAKVSDHAKYGDGYVDEYNDHEVRLAKTPEQIKQDKLKAQESEVLDLIIGEGFIVHKDLVAFLQSSGYIVEPK